MQRSGTVISFVFVVLVSISLQGNANDPLPWANPWDVGMDYHFVNQAFDEMVEAIQEKAAPGAVGIVIKDGSIITRRAVGNMQTYDIRRNVDTGELEYIPVKNHRMLEETIFDLASVTKMVATTTSIMMLAEQDKINLDDPVVKYIPSFGARAKDKVTVRHLLTHSSGLPSWLAFYQSFIDRETVYRSIDEDVELVYPPGKRRMYSDLGFIMLGRIVEVVSGMRLDQFANEHLFTPLQMNDTGYLPRIKDRLRTAPTEYDPLRNQELKGIVHDENTRAMGGVSGHAGLFSTATDLAVFAQMLLNGGEWKGKRILKAETIQEMIQPQLQNTALDDITGFMKRHKQLLGWWGMNDKAVIDYLGGLPSRLAFGHTGFTGTAIWIDPEHHAAAILLTNSVHPKREEANKTAMRRAFFVNISKALVGENKVVEEKQ